MSPLPQRGEVWWYETPDMGTRPAVVLTRDRAIPRMRRTLVAPCTTTLRGLDTEVILDPEEDPVPRPTAVNLDSIEVVSVAFLVDRMGSLSMTRMSEICAALAVAVDC